MFDFLNDQLKHFTNKCEKTNENKFTSRAKLIHHSNLVVGLLVAILWSRIGPQARSLKPWSKGWNRYIYKKMNK